MCYSGYKKQKRNRNAKNDYYLYRLPKATEWICSSAQAPELSLEPYCWVDKWYDDMYDSTIKIEKAVIYEVMAGTGSSGILVFQEMEQGSEYRRLK